VITNQDILSVLAAAINKLVQEQCQDAYQRGVDRGRLELRREQREAERKTDGQS
jgi:hypothetical protein